MAGLQQYDCKQLTYGPGLVIAAGRLKFEATGPTFDLVVDGVPNTSKTTVARNGAGDYTVTLPRIGGGWPAEVIACLVDTSYVDATDAGLDEVNVPKYVVNSYDRTNGTFKVLNVVASGALVTALGDPNDESEFHFIMVLRLDKALAQTV